MRNRYPILLSMLGAFGLLGCSGKRLHAGEDAAGGGRAGSSAGQAGSSAGQAGSSAGRAGADAGGAGAATGAAGSIMPSGAGGTGVSGGGTGGVPSVGGSTGTAGAAGGGAAPPRRLTGLANRIIALGLLLPEGTPNIIAAGSDGNLWFTDTGIFYSVLGVVTPAALFSGFLGGFSERDTTARNGEVPGGLVAGPDGAIWLTLSGGKRQSPSPPSIMRLDLTGGATIYPLDAGATPNQIAVGPDGHLWFTDPGLNHIGRATTAGLITVYPIPTAASGPLGITAGPDGALWFTETDANRIGRIETDGSMIEWPIPTAAASAQLITAAPDGALWFTERAANKIGRITTTGVFTEFDLPTPNSQPVGITAGPEGAVWFTESVGQAIGRITSAGAVTEYVTPRPNSVPWSITVGPEGNLWFTDQQAPGGSISRLTPESKPFTRLWTAAVGIDASTVCPAVTKYIDVSNIGDTPSGTLTVDLDDANPVRPRYRIQDTCSGVSLNPGDHCTIDFSLAPGAAPGVSSLTITIKPALGDTYIAFASQC